MREKNRPEGDLTPFEVEIEKLVYEGEGLGRHEGKVAFVPFAAPGDRVEVRPIEHKKGYVRAGITRILRPGPGRTDPPCPHFLRCGGCQWQHLDYAVQVEAKRKILEDLFHHRFPETGDTPILMKPSPHPYGYRSRTRLQARGTGVQSTVGFFRYRSHAVEDVNMCPLFRPALNAALEKMRHERGEGRLGPAEQELELACAEEGNWAIAEAETAQHNHGQPEEDVLWRQVGEFTYATAPSVFFQANDFMVDELIGAVLDAGGAGDAALDLYSGVGFFSLPLARRFRNVVSVESSPQAHQLCIRNASRAGIENLTPWCADVRAWMEAAGSVSAPAFDLILLDPPRSGVEPEVMKKLAEWTPETIVYVSCNPQTLARDLAALPARNYQIDRIVGMDLFPQTYHFETVVRLVRR